MLAGLGARKEASGPCPRAIGTRKGNERAGTCEGPSHSLSSRCNPTPYAMEPALVRAVMPSRCAALTASARVATPSLTNIAAR
jgi:hypothetical protein